MWSDIQGYRDTSRYLAVSCAPQSGVSLRVNLVMEHLEELANTNTLSGSQDIIHIHAKCVMEHLEELANTNTLSGSQDIIHIHAKHASLPTNN